MTALQSNQRYCRDCGAVNLAQRGSCWLCSGSLAGPAWNAPPKEPPAWMPDRESLTIFDMVGGAIAGLVVLCLGIGVVANFQVLGGVLLLIMIPLALAALAHVFREHRRGKQLGYLEIFLGAMGGAVVLALLGLAILIALFIACLSLIMPRGGFH